jgi:hypothetical protein
MATIIYSLSKPFFVMDRNTSFDSSKIAVVSQSTSGMELVYAKIRSENSLQEKQTRERDESFFSSRSEAISLRAVGRKHVGEILRIATITQVNK